MPAPAPQTIADEIKAVRSQMREQVPAPIFAAFDDQADRLAGRGFAPQAPQPGEPAPEFTLADGHGEVVSLSALLADAAGLGSDGRVRLAAVDGDFRRRAEVSALLAALDRG